MVASPIEVEPEDVSEEVEAALTRLEAQSPAYGSGSGSGGEGEESPSAPIASRSPSNISPSEFEMIGRIARAMIASGYFKDVQSVAQAGTRIMAGREVGLGPFASMAGIYFVNGKPQYFALVLAGLIKKSRRYNYRVRESTDRLCRIEFFEHGESVGFSEWTIEKARRAGLENKPGPWKLFPHAMLYNRAMAEGARMHCPDIFAGAGYVEGELEEEIALEGGSEQTSAAQL